MKIAFFGTGEFSKSIGEKLIENEVFEVDYLVSQPDRPVGRKKILEKTAVKKMAEHYSIDISQPEKLINNEEFLSGLEARELDFIVVVAYGKIVPKRVLNAAKYGCINLHGSILPLYRGASPIQASIKNGDTETGLTLMYMTLGMDEGDILKIEKIHIDNEDTTEDVFTKMSKVGPTLIEDGLSKILEGTLEGIAQDEMKATYCSKISKQDGEIDFVNNAATEIYNTYRAYSIWPGIYSEYMGLKFSIEECYTKEHYLVYDDEFSAGDVVEFEQDGKKEIAILCREGSLVLMQVKLAGKKSMDILSFINGNKEFLDHKF